MKKRRYFNSRAVTNNGGSYSKNTISFIIPYKKFVEHNDETDEKADYSLDIYDSFVLSV